MSAACRRRRVRSPAMSSTRGPGASSVHRRAGHGRAVRGDQRRLRRPPRRTARRPRRTGRRSRGVERAPIVHETRTAPAPCARRPSTRMHPYTDPTGQRRPSATRSSRPSRAPRPTSRGRPLASSSPSTATSGRFEGRNAIQSDWKMVYRANDQARAAAPADPGRDRRRMGARRSRPSSPGARGARSPRLAHRRRWSAAGARRARVSLLAWQMMIAAMMLPSSLPLVGLFAGATARAPRRRRSMAGSCRIPRVWTGFGARGLPARRRRARGGRRQLLAPRELRFIGG